MVSKETSETDLEAIRQAVITISSYFNVELHEFDDDDAMTEALLANRAPALSSEGGARSKPKANKAAPQRGWNARANKN